MTQYTTLKQLAEAFANGELDRRDYFLCIDKGGSQLNLQHYGTALTDEQVDAKYEDCQRIFKRPYGCPVQELLSMVGINSENA